MQIFSRYGTCLALSCCAALSRSLFSRSGFCIRRGRSATTHSRWPIAPSSSVGYRYGFRRSTISSLLLADAKGFHTLGSRSASTAAARQYEKWCSKTWLNSIMFWIETERREKQPLQGDLRCERRRWRRSKLVGTCLLTVRSIMLWRSIGKMEILFFNSVSSNVS